MLIRGVGVGERRRGQRVYILCVRAREGRPRPLYVVERTSVGYTKVRAASRPLEEMV